MGMRCREIGNIFFLYFFWWGAAVAIDYSLFGVERGRESVVWGVFYPSNSDESTSDASFFWG